MNTQDAYKVAKKARENSYSPYSHFAVGAALKIKGSEVIIPGCNVENASFGGTICAERAAILSAISQFGRVGFEYLVVVTDTTPASLPCAFCLGVLAEFCKPDFPIHLANLDGIERTVTLGDLLPHPFVLVENPLA